MIAVSRSSFTTLAPGLGQVFFIGDGLAGTGTGSLQQFIAPPGATRLFLCAADGFGLSTGQPGAYDDNDGSLDVLVLAGSAGLAGWPAGRSISTAI